MSWGHWPTTRIVAYPKTEWSRGDAWNHLHAQQIPGCPKTPLLGDSSKADPSEWGHGWRKDHTADEWRWYYLHGVGDAEIAARVEDMIVHDSELR